MKDDRLYVIHILECIERIEQYTNTGEETFLKDRKSQDAVLRNLHTLSESTQRLSQDLKNKHPNVRWQAIAAFRNVLVHDYLGVNIKRVWNIVESDLRDLKNKIRSIRDAS